MAEAVLTRPRAMGRSRLVRVAAVALGALALLAALLYVAICCVLVLELSRPQRHPFTHFPGQYGLTFSAVTFPSRVDAIPLSGWLLAPATGVPVERPVVIVPGRGQDRESEVFGHVLEIAAALTRQGHPVLVFDLRGSGQSGGEHFTLGGLEGRDVAGAIDALQGQGLAANGVDVLGYSMGAATAMLEAAGDPRVHALIEDSGYATLDDVLAVQVPKESHLPPFFTPGLIAMARPLLGVDADAIRPVAAVPALAARHVPFMVIQGEADDIVPPDHGRRLAAAYGPGAVTYFVPGGRHTGSYLVAPAQYLGRVTAFLASSE